MTFWKTLAAGVAMSLIAFVPAQSGKPPRRHHPAGNDQCRRGPRNPALRSDRRQHAAGRVRRVPGAHDRPRSRRQDQPRRYDRRQPDPEPDLRQARHRDLVVLDHGRAGQDHRVHQHGLCRQQVLRRQRTTKVAALPELVGKTVGVTRASTNDIVMTNKAVEGTNIQRYDDDASTIAGARSPDRSTGSSPAGRSPRRSASEPQSEDPVPRFVGPRWPSA